MAHELLAKGVVLDGSVWLYEVRNLPHVPRDQPGEVFPPGDNGERLGPYHSAAIRNMRDLLRDDVAPPRSRIAGRIDASGALVIDVSGGTTTTAPVREDPAIDTVQVDAMLTPRAIGAAESARWQAVTAALDHDEDAITGPSIACRVGAFRIRFFGAELTPFAPEALAATYGSFRGYRRSVQDVVEALGCERLYDARIESARETAERSRAFFPEVEEPRGGCR